MDNSFENERKYLLIKQLISNKQYDDANQMLKEINGYRDSEELKKQCEMHLESLRKSYNSETEDAQVQDLKMEKSTNKTKAKLAANVIVFLIILGVVAVIFNLSKCAVGSVSKVAIEISQHQELKREEEKREANRELINSLSKLKKFDTIKMGKDAFGNDIEWYILSTNANDSYGVYIYLSLLSKYIIDYVPVYSVQFDKDEKLDLWKYVKKWPYGDYLTLDESSVSWLSELIPRAKLNYFGPSSWHYTDEEEFENIPQNIKVSTGTDDANKKFDTFPNKSKFSLKNSYLVNGEFDTQLDVERIWEETKSELNGITNGGFTYGQDDFIINAEGIEEPIFTYINHDYDINDEKSFLEVPQIISGFRPIINVRIGGFDRDYTTIIKIK